ncbi:LpxI family protein [Paracoccus aminophilus]|uniref:Phosphatidate cytidylyltransferase n=1 Tax=Paracoccus aminophilus JCM 7686 TaxID=1367847 RepID=S5XXL7_PARAH|nr:UDP-2,3-diacylglucosamine diphosphatase LpxI [Paracoccus aminophilus]AGT08180.1 hypothetical protein JCM7686_1071 [Paracoccus aminophilus JCM 7686]
MSRIAIIAGEGELAPAIVAELDAPLIYALAGLSPKVAAEPFRLERLIPFLDHLLDHDVSEVVFAGAIRRPKLEPDLFDPRTLQIVPRIIAAMQTGDDAALREVLAVFEESGLAVRSVEEIAPGLVPGAGLLAGAPSDRDRKDAEEAARIVSGLGGYDIGQGAIVAQGLCMAVEALPGTDAMLEFAAKFRDLRPNPKGAKGVLYKAPKPGQDRRIDLPTLGPETVRRAAEADLAGIAWEAGGVILLDRARTIADAEAAGLFLWARD